jgi:hypothetical protein
MNLRPAIGGLVALSLGLLPAVALAQSVNVSRSILANQPYTLIYPDTMIASGEGGAAPSPSITRMPRCNAI